MHVYDVRPRKDNRGVDLISDALPFGRLWYGGPDAISNRTRKVAIPKNGHLEVLQLREDWDAGCAVHFYGNGEAKFPEIVGFARLRDSPAQGWTRV